MKLRSLTKGQLSMMLGALLIVSCQKKGDDGEHHSHGDNDNVKVEAHVDSHDTDKVEGKKKYMDKLYNETSSDQGKVQSPINIVTSEIPHKKEDVKVDFNDKIIAIENLGHTIQLDFEKGSTVTVRGVKYDFKQIHFHTPSEHLIDGMTYPMEAHIVTTISDTTLIEKGAKQYMVLGFMFKMGESNPFIEEFMGKIPAKEGGIAKVTPGEVKLDDMMDHEMAKNVHYFHYDGSLTTPPYTESVSWYVASTPLTATPAQIKKINEMIGNNARHIQGLNNREVVAE